MALLAAVCWAPQAHAEPSPLIPPSRADQRPVAPTYRPREVPRPDPAAAAPQIAPFVLAQVELHGSSLPDSLLRSVYAAQLGRRVGQAELQDIVARLDRLYATRSGVALYGLSIPAQAFEGGRLRIEVTEGYIQGARVSAPAPARSANALLRRYLERLTAERPLRRATLERYVALIRDIAGLNPSLSLQPGSQPGGFVLVVAAAPRTAELGFSINNRGTAFLGRTQAELELALHSLLRQGDDTHLSFAAPTDFRRLQYYGVSHAQPIGATGATILASAGYLRTRPDFADLHGRAMTLGLSATAPVLRRSVDNLYLTAGLDSVDSDNALLGAEITRDRIRTARLGGSYVRQGQDSYVLISGSASLGLEGLGARVLSPGVGGPGFTKYTAKAAANFALPHHFVLRLDSTGQYTADRLPGSEQLALGGEEFGRAYEADAVAGDTGVAGSAELAWRAIRLAPASLQASELYAFADGGETQRRPRPAQPAAIQQIASIGGGARLAVSSKAVFQLEAARGLLDPVPFEEHESWRAVFSVKSSF